MTNERWRRVKEIFYGAADCDPAARAGFLAESCGSDEELRKEVESLLASFDDPGTLLEKPAVEAGPIGAAVSSHALAPLVFADPGAVLPERYEVLGELGHGGMGVVYKARDRETGEVLALKVLKPEIAADPAVIDRFKNELLLAHRITHPNVARLYEFHRAGASLYLSMEYVEGESLRALLHRTGKVDVATGLNMARQLARGIAAAHRQSIAHRDLKPENIMIAAGGELKVLDFGISRSYGVNVTATGTVIGTPAYMAPEQAAGNPADQRTDIYAMGLILFEMFTGTALFTGATPVALALKQIREQPRPPRSLTPELPEYLDRAILKCLERDPADRFQSVDELLDVLEGAPDSIVVSKRDARAKRRVAAVGIAALALALVLAGTLLPVGKKNAGPPSEKRSIAVLPFVDRSPEKNQEYLADGIAEQLLNSLAAIEGLRVVGRTSAFGFKGTTEDSRSIGKKLNVNAILEGSVSKEGNQVKITVQLINASDGFSLWSKTYDREIAGVFEVQDSIARAVTEAMKVTLLERKGSGSPARPNSDAYNADLLGRYFLQNNDKESMRLAVGYFEQAIHADRRYAPSWVGLAVAHASQSTSGDRPTEEGYRLARQELETALLLDPKLAPAYVSRGRMKMLYDRDWAGADTDFQHALALEPGKLSAINESGILARIRGRFEEAIARGRQVLQVEPRAHAAYHNLGMALYYAGLYEEATPLYRKALELFPGRERTHSMLAALYLVKGQPQAALAEAQQEKNDKLQLWGTTLAYQALRRQNESAASLRDLIAKCRTQCPFLVAEVYAFRGETDPAFEWLEYAYTEHDSGITLIKGNPLLRRLETDPRYAAFLKRLRL